ncbi:SsrA-binding protein SmpB [Desulfitibacter alkalitolerans]|uniref:SsrA-binding protein SmpB n=1 Tax=Desulfitibacter alkalitolerans TaxID=264641 RepID=UPI00048061D0|nr:SsrA-binding protein SmpB [Desulfitibacter alkalitolerans]
MGIRKVITDNRKARHDYFIEETYEAGIALQGTEVKSMRLGRVNLKDSYAHIQNGQLVLSNMHISPYEKASHFNHDPLRDRKLLMHKREIMRLWGKTREKGLTLVPLKLYFNEKNRVKVEIGLAKGKKLYDKREDLAKKDAERQIKRALSDKQKY